MLLDKPEISIIIPTYNMGHYICDALNSILAQAFDNYEVIVVDDGSTDNTKVVISPYLKDKRFRYIYQVNSGHQSFPKNVGIKVARGKYLCFLDADDELLPGSFEKRIDFFKTSPEYDALFADYLVDDKIAVAPYQRLKTIGFLEFFKNTLEKKMDNAYFINKNFYSTYLCFKFNPFHTSMATIKSEIMSEIGGFMNISVADDVDFCLRIIKSNIKTGFLNEPLTIYRKIRGGIMSNPKNYFLGLLSEVGIFSNDLKSLNSSKSDIANLLKKRISRNYFLIARYIAVQISRN